MPSLVTLSRVGDRVRAPANDFSGHGSSTRPTERTNPRGGVDHDPMVEGHLLRLNHQPKQVFQRKVGI